MSKPDKPLEAATFTTALRDLTTARSLIEHVPSIVRLTCPMWCSRLATKTLDGLDILQLGLTDVLGLDRPAHVDNWMSAAGATTTNRLKEPQQHEYT